MDVILALFEPVWFIIDFIIHVDTHLYEIITKYGTLTYLILFVIVFCETGLIVTPYLPGDSLLFAAGALAAMGALNVAALIIILLAAAIIGDSVNYWLAHRYGTRMLASKRLPFVKEEHIDYTRRFFDQHGGKTIVIARFMPIVRTFAPFVAGVSEMQYRRFTMFNVTGAFLWVCSFVPLGYLFGNIPAVKKHFSLLVIGIIIISVMPIAFKFIQARRQAQQVKRQVV